MSTTMEPKTYPASVEWQGETWVPVCEGSPTYTNGKERKNLGANGLPVLSADGNPGNSGGGRPKGITRESLIEASGEAAEDYKQLRNDWLALAKAHLQKGDIDRADRCQKAADRIQERYDRYGLGSKVTTSLDNEQAIDRLGTALDSIGWMDAGQRAEVVAAYTRALAGG